MFMFNQNGASEPLVGVPPAAKIESFDLGLSEKEIDDL
jgi:hypothetical protein